MNRFLIALVTLFALGACTQGGEKLDGRPMPSQTSPAQQGNASQEPAGVGPLDIAGVAFLPPESWTDLGATQMRKASFGFGPADGDVDAAEVTAFFFGEGQGGDIESNIARWIGQMDPPEGQDIQDVVRRSKVTTQTGLDIHFVEINGTHNRSMGGGPMTGGRTKAFPGWRMVAAIIEGPQGNIFFKLVGPETTAGQMEEGFREMLSTAVKI